MLTSVLDAYFTYLNKEIVDKGITLKDRADLDAHCVTLWYLPVTCRLGLCSRSFTWLACSASACNMTCARCLFNHLQDLSLSYYAQNAVGRLIARVTSDTGRVSELLTWGVVDTTWALMNITTSLIFMAIINWKLALIVFTIIPVMLYHRGPIPQEDPGGIPRLTPHQLKDHRRIQRELPGCTRGQGLAA